MAIPNSCPKRFGSKRRGNDFHRNLEQCMFGIEHTTVVHWRRDGNRTFRGSPGNIRHMVQPVQLREARRRQGLAPMPKLPFGGGRR
jgi:hypothetical protein